MKKPSVYLYIIWGYILCPKVLEVPLQVIFLRRGYCGISALRHVLYYMVYQSAISCLIYI